MKMIKKGCRRVVSLLLAWTMVLGVAAPAVATEMVRRQSGVATVSIEYIDEQGKGVFFLPPTQVSLGEDNSLPTVLAQAYEERGSVTYSLLKGYTVTPKDGVAVGEEGWGKKAWWPFANSVKVGNKYDVEAGEVIRLLYCQDNQVGVPGYIPPAAAGAQGSLSVNKDKLFTGLAQLTQSQIQANLQAYEAALQVAVDTGATQSDVNQQTAVVDEMLKQQVPATGITVTPEQVELMVGQSCALTAEVTPAESNDTVEWSSDNTHVVQVTEQGMIRAVGEGTAVVTAQANAAVKATVTVTVTGIAAQSVTLSQDSLALKTGEGVRLGATVTPENTTDAVVWLSSNPDVAHVDDTGMVVAKQEGQAEITARAGGVQAVCTVTVTRVPEPTTPTVVFQHTDGRMTYADEQGVLTLSALDVGSFVLKGVDEGQSVYWSCSEQDGQSESSIVHIASKGTFYPHLGQRKAYVYDKDPNLWGNAKEWTSFTLKVVPTEITDLKLYQDGWEVGQEDVVHLKGTEEKQVTVKGCVDGVYVPIPVQALAVQATEGAWIYNVEDYVLGFFAEDQAMHTFTVSVSDNPQVSASFQATAKRIGVTGMTVAYPEVFYIESWNGLGQQYVGITSHDPDPARRYEVRMEPYNATEKGVVWVSHDPDIAEFQETYNNGIVPKKTGTARFTVTSVDNPGVSQDITIRFEYKHPLQQVELEEKGYTLAQYEAVNLDLKVTPANATNQRFVWTYSQDGVVQVVDYVTSTPGQIDTSHKLSALEPGTVTVTGTPLDNTHSVEPIQFTVTVTEAEKVEELDFDRYVTQNIAHSLSYLQGELEGNYVYGAEWSIFTLLRAGGSLKQRDLDAYYASLCEEVTSGNRLLPTDLFRMVVTLLAMGKDPTDVAGVNLVEMLYSYPNLDRMTSNMMAYTLLALDSKAYDVPQTGTWTRQVLVEKLLTFQNPCGGFGLSSADTYGVDITAMVLQALAPYRHIPQVQQAFDRALDYLRREMTNDCGYINEGDDNGCTAAQVLTALAVAGIDPLDPDQGFTRGNYNLVKKLDGFRRDTGFTTYMKSQEPDGMGTVQIGYALEAYRRFAAGENALYDLREWTPAPPVTGDGDASVGTDQGGPSQDGGSQDGAGQNGANQNPGVPETGDQGDIVLNAMAFMVGAAGVYAVGWLRRKRTSK